MAFAGHAAAAVIVAITLASTFLGASKMGVERSAAAFVAPNMPVDRFVVDRKHRSSRKPTGNLLGLQRSLRSALTRSKSSVVNCWFLRDRERRPLAISCALLAR
jgi:hypothetical protein